MENTNSLGREIKIANLMAQRNFLETMLTKECITHSHIGSSTITYIGYIFPENIAWLKANDISISKHEPKEEFPGTTTYLLTPSDDIMLTNEELAKSACIAEKANVEAAEPELIKAVVAALEEIRKTPKAHRDCYDYNDECDFQNGCGRQDKSGGKH